MYLMIICIIIKITANAHFRYRIYKASIQRCHGALEDPIALSQHAL